MYAMKNPTIWPLSPKPYQLEGFNLAINEEAFAFFGEQGTGKTNMAVAVIAHRLAQGEIGRALVVCSKALKPDWEREVAHLESVDVITYDSIFPEKNTLKKRKYGMVVLDESKRIKRRNSQRSRGVRSLSRSIKFKLILDGTPVTQSPVDLWAQFNLLKPNLLGKFSSFKDTYCKIGGYLNKQILGFKNLEDLVEVIKPYYFRVLKEDVLDLPDRHDHIVWITLSKSSRDLYQRMNRDLEIWVDSHSVSVDMEATKVMKLRQMVGGMVKGDCGELIPIGVEKAQELRKLLARIDHKAIIFCSFRHELEIIQEVCDYLCQGHVTLSGKVKMNERDHLLSKFRKDKLTSRLICQISVGSEGLNLVEAKSTIYYSPTYSIGHLLQSKDRNHRIGQDTEVHYYYLLVKDSIDEKIHKKTLNTFTNLLD